MPCRGNFAAAWKTPPTKSADCFRSTSTQIDKLIEFLERIKASTLEKLPDVN
jgi:hypothetical protein